MLLSIIAFKHKQKYPTKLNFTWYCLHLIEMGVKLYKSFVVVNKNLLTKYLKGNHTYMVAGPTRSGTSCISLTLKAANIFMGSSEIKNLHEYDAIGQNLDNKNILIKIIKENNEKHKIWGFKYPKSTLYYPFFSNILRAPIAIFCYRNLISTSQSALRHNNKFSENNLGQFISQYNNNIGFYNHMMMSIKNIKRPYILIEYEKVLLQPKQFVDEFFDLLGIKVSAEKMQILLNNISTPGYKNADAIT